ncbi:hypothetical protein M084_3947, partial [Bacteroides fragilis str. 3988 T1]
FIHYLLLFNKIVVQRAVIKKIIIINSCILLKVIASLPRDIVIL